jgi:hypothetical protein
MAALIGPLHSLDARGALADTLIYSKQRGSNYCKAYAVPDNPKSDAQSLQRCAIAAITKGWAQLDLINQQQWEDIPRPQHQSAYHAYLNYQCRRWRQSLPPIGTPYPPEPITAENVYATDDPIGNLHRITLTVENPDNVLWLAQFCFDTTSPPTAEKPTTKGFAFFTTEDYETYTAYFEWEGLWYETYYPIIVAHGSAGGQLQPTEPGA